MAETSQMQHQPGGIALRGVLWGGVAIVAGILLAVAVSWWLWDRWGRPAGPNIAVESDFARPTLQVAPLQERAQYFAEKQALLDSWAWIDSGKGVARIPVEQAMQIMAARAGDGAAKEQR